MSPEKNPSKKPVKRPIKKPVRDIMIPRRRDFMGDLGDWVAESPENEKEFEAMVGEIFEELGIGKKAGGDVPPPSGKKFKEVKKKTSYKKSITKKKAPTKPSHKKK